MRTSTSIPIRESPRDDVSSDPHLLAPDTVVHGQSANAAGSCLQQSSTTASDQPYNSPQTTTASDEHATSNMNLPSQIETCVTAENRSALPDHTVTIHEESGLHVPNEPLSSLHAEPTRDPTTNAHPMQVPCDSTTNVHPMQTRGKSGIRKPKVYTIEGGHQNSLEMMPMFLVLLILGGMGHACVYVALRLLYTISRYFNFNGYATGDPNNRLPLGRFGFVTLFGLMICTVSFGINLLRL
ncbi:hypothetical protein GQ457_09G022710 [Hibiscus cannabinus]